MRSQSPDEGEGHESVCRLLGRRRFLAGSGRLSGSRCVAGSRRLGRSNRGSGRGFGRRDLRMHDLARDRSRHDDDADDDPDRVVSGTATDQSFVHGVAGRMDAGAFRLRALLCILGSACCHLPCFPSLCRCATSPQSLASSALRTDALRSAARHGSTAKDRRRAPTSSSARAGDAIRVRRPLPETAMSLAPSSLGG